MNTPFGNMITTAEHAIAMMFAVARQIQTQRFGAESLLRQNADAQGAILEEIATPDNEGRELLLKVAERFGLSARGFHRVLRVARTIADLERSDPVLKHHVAEAVSFRLAETRELVAN